ncbi:hypothetical protein AArcSl_1283 [Halalkaliarchaeum desulfuricum]|uniref:Uncharacterized protein n=1 Tax=Halalkaliarchaeum desulfuricum TaxID=2055893 RepID=A0A343TIJ2_9EURY|nr:hypothetical protein [Halalkaliarchaeum desulfuricum]AUX08914.1 hypothetical protein AArcSl_1283 [Halalkaliarchaeum desulfuricum]
MPETIQDPKLVVRDILRDEWDNDAVPTELEERDIHTGWFDDGKGFPQIAVSNRNEDLSTVTDTGFTAIAGDGSGGVQDRTGTVLVTAFAGSRDEYDSRGIERLQAEDMGNEISRIIGRNQSPGEYLALAVGPREDLVDDEVSPTEYAVQFRIRYLWKKEPARD